MRERVSEVTTEVTTLCIWGKGIVSLHCPTTQEVDICATWVPRHVSLPDLFLLLPRGPCPRPYIYPPSSPSSVTKFKLASSSSPSSRCLSFCFFLLRHRSEVVVTSNCACGDQAAKMDKSILAAAATADCPGGCSSATKPSRYESQKRRDWHTFGQYLRNHRPPLELSRCSGAHVLEFLRYLDQFGKTKVHAPACPFFGHPAPPASCPCPLKQAWGSLDALIGRLRAAFEEHGGLPEANPFGARAVRLYLRDVRDTQAKARGIAYEKKRRRRHSSSASKQAKMQQQQQQEEEEDEHHHGAAAAAAEMRRDSKPGHFLIPHAHFFHGHYFAPPLPPATHQQAVGHDGPVPTVGVVGEDMALAMAEAHATGGYMMPLSVFH